MAAHWNMRDASNAKSGGSLLLTENPDNTTLFPSLKELVHREEVIVIRGHITVAP